MPLGTDIDKLHQQAPARLLEATVLDPPLDANGWLRVSVASQGTSISVPWTPRIDVDPLPGDAAALEESDEGNYWCVQWWPQGGQVPRQYQPLPAPPEWYKTAGGVLVPGLAGQRRMGRIWSLADFTQLLQIAAPNALYPLSDLSDISGSGLTLGNTTAAVPFDGNGPTGLPNTAARFSGNVNQGLFLADGSGGKFNPRTITVGCLFITSKRGTSQRLLAKGTNVAGSRSWVLTCSSSNSGLQLQVSTDGTAQTLVNGTSDVMDGRWHIGFATYDGETVCVYVDGNLEARVTTVGGSLNQGSMPFNIGNGGISAAAGTGNEGLPMFGRIASAVVTADVLSDEQIRLLSAAALPHGAPSVPEEVVASVTRKRRGKPLVQSDFTSPLGAVQAAQPRRVYSHNNLSLTDVGADGSNLTASGTPIAVAGPDGRARAAAFLPSAVFYTAPTPACFSGQNTRSAGCWFCLPVNVASYRTMICLGGGSATDMRMLYVAANGGQLTCYDGTTTLSSALAYDDGRWHFAVSVWDNAATDGIKRKLFVDGRCVAGDANFASTTVTGGSLYIGRRGTTTTEDLIGMIANSFICDYALTPEQISALFALGSRDLPPSQFPAEALVEAMDDTNLYVIGEGLEPQHSVEFKARVAA